MGKTIQIEVPDWVDEMFIVEVVKKLVDVEAQRRKIVEKILKKLKLAEKDLEEFEKFREELWKREAKEFFSL